MIEIEMPDGTVLEFPEGTDPATMQKVAADYWAKQSVNKGPVADQTSMAAPQQSGGAQEAQPQPERLARGERPPMKYGKTSAIRGEAQVADKTGPFRGDAFAYGLGNAMTLGMGQEINAAIGSAFTDETYSEALAREEGKQAQFAELPGYNVGNVAGSLAPFTAGSNFIRGAASLPGLMARSGFVGAGYGAVSGAGDSGGLGDRAESALVGAGIGGLAGAAIPGVVGLGSRLLGGNVAGVADDVANSVPTAVSITDQGVADVLGAAAKAKPGSAGAERLAAEAMPDQATMAAAERLGFDLPADVYATNPLIRRAAGGVRGIVGSEAESAWINTVAKAVDKADEVMAGLAKMDVSAISDNVSDTLRGAQSTLKAQAGKLYAQVEAAVPKATKVATNRAVALLEERAADLGGVAKLAPGERALLKSLKANPTYEWAKTQKGKMGQSAFGQPDQFPNFDKAFLRRLTGAMGEDLIDAAETVGGKEVREALRLANRLTAKQKGLEERIVSAFGKDGFGSIANKLGAAVRAGAKGDLGGLNKMLHILPDEAQADAIAASIAGLSKGRTAQGGFGFAEFSKLWGGIKGNSKVSELIREKLGPDAAGVLDDLYRVSRALTDARGNVATTGKANQWLEMVPRGVVQRAAESGAGKQTIRGTLIGGGASVGGPAGAIAGSALSEMLTKGGKPVMESAGRLFRSPEFLSAMRNAGDMTPEKLAALPAMKRWAKEQNIQDLAGWVQGLIKPAATAAAQQTQSPDYEGLRRRYAQ